MNKNLVRSDLLTLSRQFSRDEQNPSKTHAVDEKDDSTG
jgi:hypothetical protein